MVGWLVGYRTEDKALFLATLSGDEQEPCIIVGSAETVRKHDHDDDDEDDYYYYDWEYLLNCTAGRINNAQGTM